MDNPSIQPTPLNKPPSGDGDSLMEFGEVELRPLEKRNEPSRDRSFATQVVGAASPNDLPIYLDLAACEDIETHAREDTDNEVGGVLLGKQYEGRGGPFVHIVRALPAQHVEHSSTHLKFTHDTWEALAREKDEVAPELDIVGWYHTHPGLTVFMSSYDRFIHDNFFNRPQDVALVVDPLANDRGFFHWEKNNGNKLRRCTGFHVVAPRHEKVALQQLSQALQTRPLSPFGIGGEKETDEMRVTFKDLVLTMFVLIAVFQSLMMWNFSTQRTMMQEMFSSLPFSQEDWAAKNKSLLKEKKEFKEQIKKLEKENKNFADKVKKLEEAKRTLEKVVKDKEGLDQEVSRLDKENKAFEERINELGGKAPRGLLEQRIRLPLAVGGAVLLAILAALVTAVVMTLKHRQPSEVQPAETAKPET